jgi:pimeloyl-ACP methyl ester carboxylesterase
MHRRLRIAAGIALAAAGLYLAGGFAAARYLTMPYPARVRDLTPGHRDAVRAPDGLRLAVWRNDVPNARATAVLAHGYRNDRRLLQALAPALAMRGIRSVALDFRGHGESEGDRITLGVTEARDVGAVLDHAATLGGPVLYVGFSMGAVAYLLSGREAHAAVLDSPYATLRLALASRLRSAGIPAPLGLSTIAFFSGRLPVSVDAVRPVDAAAKLARPTLFVFAERDHWVSPEARALYRSARPSGAVIDEIAGAGHADHFTAAWVERVATFLAASLDVP